MAQDGKVLWAIAAANARLIFAEGDVQDPVEGVFDLPVVSSVLEDLGCGISVTGDEVAVFDRTLVAHPSLGTEFDPGPPLAMPLGKTHAFSPWSSFQSIDRPVITSPSDPTCIARAHMACFLLESQHSAAC
jgi:hypothetical protein